MSNKKVTYADAGVNLEVWNTTKKEIGKLVKSTYTSKVIGKFGQFGGMFDISFVKNCDNPILVSSVDGVGTKLKIAYKTGKHYGIGYDIVNHCVDDILVMGAKPLFFLDYIGTGVLTPETTLEFMQGLTSACKENGIVLIGGETAEMPGVYNKGEYDIAGTIVGIVDEQKVIDGSRITPGDKLIGLKSNGLHTNGYSLARKIVEEIAKMDYSDIFEPTGRTIGEELLRPHRSYLSILKLIETNIIDGCAHITGGGFYDNVDRILPDNCSAVIKAKNWKPEPVFEFLMETGGVDKEEMYHTFNMGIGMVISVKRNIAEDVLNSDILNKFEPVIIGDIVKGDGTVSVEF